MVDHEGVPLIVNRRFFELWELPIGSVVPGMSYIELVDAIVSQGNILPVDMAEIRRQREILTKRNARSTFPSTTPRRGNSSVSRSPSFK